MLARLLWSTLLRLGTPLYLARLWWRGRREPGYRLGWAERLGRLPQPVPPGAVWVHAVSLGETRAAAALLAELRHLRPGTRLLLTHGTATGREAGSTLLQQGDHQCWLPYDTPGAVRRFLDATRPCVGVLMETEIWPNLLHEARRRDLPMVLANARLSEKSARRGRRFASLLRPAVQSLALVLAQTPEDRKRLREAGAPEVVLAGNLKFDMTPAPDLLQRGRAWRERLASRGHQVVMAASTREGEEALLLQAWAAMDAPRPLLLLVPRHPQRFDEVAALVRDFGFMLARRTQWGEAPPLAACDADVWLGDSLNEMPMYYASAHAALLGGSFAKLGGQNLIEAAACGCPVVMGPHTFNFSEAAERALQAGAAVRVENLNEGVDRAVRMALDAEQPQWSQRAQDFAAGHRGAARRMARAVLQQAGLELPAAAAAPTRW